MVGDAVSSVSAFIHSLQKERGVSNVYLGSRGLEFCERLATTRAASRTDQAAVCEVFDRLQEVASEAAFDARLFSRIACVVQDLESLDLMRARIADVAATAAEATAYFVDLISALLAIVFEASDATADAETSRALVAMFSFMQGKEFAGQERATAAAGFSSGRFTHLQHSQLLKLIDAQTRSFQFFTKFAAPELKALYDDKLSGPDMIEFERLRRIACLAGPTAGLTGITSQQWYDQATRRMDAMRVVERKLDEDLQDLCKAKLAAAEIATGAGDLIDFPAGETARYQFAFVIGGADEALLTDAAETGAEVLSVDGVSPRVGRSILDIVQSQAGRLQQMSEELEAARMAMNERKIIDRAKGILMRHRGASEQEAYELLRTTAMSQNRRIKEVADAVISMSDILKPA
ncbi:MAG: nitrate- and nitrite sensing domain-containing protein [Beijerinckiaceae bacterium]|nr:nitrate- and nitrite sensing domain-containing protein [Beijerinckiaceae bacterium]